MYSRDDIEGDSAALLRGWLQVARQIEILIRTIAVLDQPTIRQLPPGESDRIRRR